VEMQRTKALGLLYKQLRKDSAMSRQGLADYLCTFRKPGTNEDPIEHASDDLPLPLWQRYASPVWMDVCQTRVLNGTVAREERDERHICPLQLDVIDRAIDLWANPDDILLDPFVGIGSTVVQAVKRGRRGIGIELKPSYYQQACRNVQGAELARTQGTLPLPEAP
jgi:DNA modification methylase